ncbi:MAG TPA: SBBP repeat-containing protein [Candidatus Angelobacter sp.]|nr:SBBP repeat-containing protein [Candidatus Angelobacter sp.]
MLRLQKFNLFVIPVALVLALACLIVQKQGSSHRRVRMQNSSVVPQAQPELKLAGVAGQDKAQDRLRIEADYGNLPLSFEANQGQTDPRVKFISRGRNRTLWLTANEAVLAVGRPRRAIARDAKQANVPPAPSPQKDDAVPAVLRMKFAGADPNPVIAGESKQTGTVNYFIGKPDQWRTKIPTFARVRYRSLYPGIDLVFYGNNRQLEYDLVVSPGADPGKIRLAIEGAQRIKIDAEGNLVLETSQGDVIQQKPKIYQRKGATLTAVAGDYVITGKTDVGFRLGNYDRKAPVFIDPVLRYSSYLSGAGDENDVGTGIAVDSSDRAVVAGWTNSSRFPGENGKENPGFSAFVVKLDVTGSRVIFTAFVEDGNPNFHTVPLALDPAGNIYIAGIALHAGLVTTTSGVFQRSFGGGTDAWVAKLDSTGTRLIYVTLLGGSGDEVPTAIAADSAGSAYVTGFTTSKNFPVTAGVFQRECKLKSDGSCASAFVTKFSPLGTRALYSMYLGGHGTQSGQGIAVNSNANAFVTGSTDAKDFPTTAGTAQPVPAGGEDAFVTQISGSGSHLNYSTFLGGSSEDSAQAIALDAVGNAFVTGFTASTNFPVKNAFTPSCSVGCGFVSKLNTSGRLVYSTFIRGGSGTGIAVTRDGLAYITGNAGANFLTTENAFQRVFPPSQFPDLPPATSGIFITKLGATGFLSYASLFGGNVGGASVALDRFGNPHLTGEVGPSPFGQIPVTPGAFQETQGAEVDGFVAKVVALCALSTVNRTVTICSPLNGRTVVSPVRVTSGTTSVTPVRLTQIYLDGKKIYQARLSAISVLIPMSTGTHRLTVQAFDTSEVIFNKTIRVNVVR